MTEIQFWTLIAILLGGFIKLSVQVATEGSLIRIHHRAALQVHNSKTWSLLKRLSLSEVDAHARLDDRPIMGMPAHETQQFVILLARSLQEKEVE